MLGLAGQGLVESLLFEQAVHAQTVSRVSLKLRKEPKHLDVMLAGIGASARVVQEQSTSTSWRGEIQRSDQEVSSKEVAQQLAMPELGVASVRLRGSGSTFELELTSVAGTVLPKPKILATGDDLVLRFRGLTNTVITGQTGSFDLRRPGRIPQPISAPPLRSRAVAPPVGDMAVGSMLIGNRSFVQVSGPPVTLTLNNAPAKDALMALARLGDYGFVYVAAPKDSEEDQSDSDENDSTDAAITMAFRGESYAKALNSVLMASGLQGKLDGRTLLVGTSVSAKTFGPQMSKVFRLNQVDVASALNYLGSLGTKVNVANTVTATSIEGSALTSDGSGSSEDEETPKSRIVESYGAEVGPLVGLVGTADARLNTLVLVGDPKLIAVAEAYLKQIDLRKRQVAVKVQILNVDLTNDKTIDSSFSARMGNTFIVSENGRAFMNFGAYKPGGSSGTGVYDGSGYAQPGIYPRGDDPDLVQLQRRVSPVLQKNQTTTTVTSGSTGSDGSFLGETRTTTSGATDSLGRPIYVKDNDPTKEVVLVKEYDKYGRPKYVKDVNPSTRKYPQDSFYSYLEASIISSSTKTLAQPTLLVQEGQEAEVNSGTSVITSVTTTDTSNGSTQFEYVRENAGLNLKVQVSKIDDNGFVSMTINPQISVPLSAGKSNGVDIFNISGRSLSSGSIRLRDRQTLVLTGVINEQDIEKAQKWPILGDLPLIGQFFRSSGSSSVKNELVILVTPVIVDDNNGGSYGYGYKPGTAEATRLIGSDSFK